MLVFVVFLYKRAEETHNKPIKVTSKKRVIIEGEKGKVLGEGKKSARIKNKEKGIALALLILGAFITHSSGAILLIFFFFDTRPGFYYKNSWLSLLTMFLFGFLLLIFGIYLRKRAKYINNESINNTSKKRFVEGLNIKYCERCNKANKIEAKFCQQCGKKL
ncbi:MAG: hypothetical protein ACFFAN_12315 [Promethearchaeota archaeon]